MASIEDVANQINAKLDAIAGSTEATTVNTSDTLTVVQEIRDLTAQTNNRLTAIDGNLESGFANLSQGIFAILEVQRLTAQLLDHHRRQHDTIICELANANDLLCGITRKLTVEVDTGKSLLTSLQRLEGIAEREQSSAAADYDRDLELERHIEECCPPPPPEVEPCPEACERPAFDPREPEGQDWKPLPPRQDPIG